MAEKSLSEQVQVRARLLLADGYFRLGWLEPGLKIYEQETTEPLSELLTICGDQCLKRYSQGRELEQSLVSLPWHKWGDYAMRAYSQACVTDKILILGDTARKLEDDELAIKCYELGGAKKALVEIGDKYFEKYKLTVSRSHSVQYHHCSKPALRAYIAAKATQRLIKLGDLCLDEDNDVSTALEAYIAANATQKIARVGKLMFESDAMETLVSWRLGIAHQAFKALNDNVMLVACAEKFLSKPRDIQGYELSFALETYTTANTQPPLEKLTALGDWYLEQRRVGEAEQVFQYIAQHQIS